MQARCRPPYVERLHGTRFGRRNTKPRYLFPRIRVPQELRQQEAQFKQLDGALAEARQALLRGQEEENKAAGGGGFWSWGLSTRDAPKQAQPATSSDVQAYRTAASAAEAAGAAAGWASYKTAAASAAAAEQPPSPPPSEFDQLFSTPMGLLNRLVAAAVGTVTKLQAPEEQKRRLEGARLKLKSDMLLLVAALDRGAAASPLDRSRVELLARQLEDLNPTLKPMRSTLNNGRWNIVYTTSGQLLGEGRPGLLRPSGPLYLAFNTEDGAALLQQSWPVKEERARLKPVSDTGMLLEFDAARLFGFFSLPSGSTREFSFVETLYLDIDMRVMRGACILAGAAVCVLVRLIRRVHTLWRAGSNNTLYVLIMDDPFYIIKPAGAGWDRLLPKGRGKGKSS